MEPDEVLGLRTGAARAGGAGRGEEAGRILDALDPLHASPLLLRDVSQVPTFFGAVAPDVLGEVEHLRGESALGARLLVPLPVLLLVVAGLCLVASLDARGDGLFQIFRVQALQLVLREVVVAVVCQVVFQLVLAGPAVDEGVVRGVAPHLLGGEAVPRDPRTEGLAPAAHVPRAQVADVRHLVCGVLDVAGPGPEE